MSARTGTRKVKRKLPRELLIAGIATVLTFGVIVAAIAYDVREAAKCKARTCPGEQIPVLIDVYCVCMTEATP